MVGALWIKLLVTELKNVSASCIRLSMKSCFIPTSKLLITSGCNKGLEVLNPPPPGAGGAKSKSNNNQPATRRPKHKFIANLSHNWDNKLDTLVGLFVRSSATDFDATNKTDGFATVRAALTYQYNKNIKLTLRGENLLDEDYIDLGGFGTAGINGYGGFIYMFD